MKRIYLDCNATTPVAPEVFEAMSLCLQKYWGNPSSVHQNGAEAEQQLESARKKVAGAFGPAAGPGNVVFTAGGTESDNLALIGIFEQFAAKGNHIITTTVEHPAIINTCRYLETKRGAKVTYLPVDGQGLLDLNRLSEAISEKTILISAMYANNETGVISPMEEIGKLAHEHDVLFHTDAVQALGKIDIDAQAIGADLISVSAHKIYAPKGIGVLYIRNGLRLQTQIHGGQQEDGRRAGTENIAGAVALGRAVELVAEHASVERQNMARLRDRLWRELNEAIPQLLLNGQADLRTCNTLNVSFVGVEGESVVLHLDAQGIAASSGSACSSGEAEPSPVLVAMGISAADASSSVRFSLGRFTTEADIDRVIEVTPPIVEKLRQISPLWQEKKSK
jgi:cysteine desulfurase